MLNVLRHCFCFVGRSYCHFLLAGVIAIVFIWWQMLLPLWLLFLPLVGILYHFCERCYCHLCWLMLLPCFVAVFVADVMATMADGIAIYKIDVIARCYYHLCWLMLLPYFVAVFVADVMATMADGIAICKIDVIARCYCHLCWLMLLPYFVAVFVADVMATMADGIAICKIDVIGRCYLPGWKMEYPTQVDVWSDVMTLCSRWNGH